VRQPIKILLIGTVLAGTGITGCATSTRSAEPHLSASGAHLQRPPVAIEVAAPGQGRPHAPPTASGPRSDADGRIPSDVYISAFSTSAAVSRLDPAVDSALRSAARAARKDGVDLRVSSGWRSKVYQQELLNEGVRTYGSLEAALHWVATPDTSHHVSGEAVDVGPKEAASWLEANGSQFGLCRLYENEPWHFEIRMQALEGGPCPPRYPDDTFDPDVRR
jgi:D-alanyl-D-alanine carboxypeptidase